MIKLTKILPTLTLTVALAMALSPAKAQSIDQLGKQMAKQVNSIRSSNSATLSSSSSETTSDEETQALIAGIPRPKSQTTTSSNLNLNREYYSDFVGPLGVGKIFVPIINPSCTMADVKKYMSAPNVEEDDDSGTLTFTLYSDASKDEELATYTYMFMNGSFISAMIMFNDGVNRDKCLAWMVKHYKYENSNVEGGMDMHTFKSKDGKVHANVNFMSMNGSSTNATIMYTKY